MSQIEKLAASRYSKPNGAMERIRAAGLPIALTLAACMSGGCKSKTHPSLTDTAQAHAELPANGEMRKQLLALNEELSKIAIENKIVEGPTGKQDHFEGERFFSQQIGNFHVNFTVEPVTTWHDDEQAARIPPVTDKAKLIFKVWWNPPGSDDDTIPAGWERVQNVSVEFSNNGKPLPLTGETRPQKDTGDIVAEVDTRLLPENNFGVKIASVEQASFYTPAPIK